MYPPALCDSVKGEVKIIADDGGCLCGNGVLDSVNECIDVTINNVTANNNNVPSWVTIIHRKVRLEVPNVFWPPAVSQLNDLRLNRRGWLLLLLLLL